MVSPVNVNKVLAKFEKVYKFVARGHVTEVYVKKHLACMSTAWVGCMESERKEFKTSKAELSTT